MILLDFLKSPCAVCDKNSFNFIYVTKSPRTTPLKLDGETLFGNIDDCSFFIDASRNEISAHGRMPGFVTKFTIEKECTQEHYRSSTRFISRRPGRDLNVPDELLYESVRLRFGDKEDSRVPDGGGYLFFINKYIKGITLLETVNGKKKLPLISLDRFDFKDPISVVNKLESLMVLI